MCDDAGAHKTQNVWNFCWSRGYVRIVLGGGTTPVAQTCDTDLNEHVRREYGKKESRLLLEKMRNGQVVPKMTHEECMQLMLDVLSDPALHRGAAEGYKKVGESIDLYGKEDGLSVGRQERSGTRKRPTSSQACVQQMMQSWPQSRMSFRQVGPHGASETPCV